MLTKKENIKDEIKVSKSTKNCTSSKTQEGTNCCQPSTKPVNLPPAKTTPTPLVKTTDNSSEKKCCSSKTRITIKFDAGYPNQMFIRGKGANLSWEKGQPMKNVKADEWSWETEIPFSACEFKVLINDRVYENGENHHINGGAVILYTPHFN